MILRILALLCVAALPIYTFESGGLQISHILIIFIFLYTVISSDFKVRGYEYIYIALSAYVLVREAVDVYIFGVGFDGLISVFYTVFPLLIIFSFGRFDLDKDNGKFLVWGLFSSIFIAAIGIYQIGASFTVEEGAITRAIGTFNNPNQLAYYSVSMMSILSLLFLRKIINNLSYLLGMVFLVLLSLLSLSKAGMIATIFPVFLGILTLNRDRRPSFATLVMFGLFSVTFFVAYLSGAFDDFSFVRRLDSLGADRDDSLAARGYGAVFEAGGLYVVFGMAQQGVIDFMGHEVHSTIFSYISKYGLIGGGLFLTFLWQWLIRVLKEQGWVGVALIVLPPMLYGITHNGSRFSVFWILVALCFAPFSRPPPSGEKFSGLERRS